MSYPWLSLAQSAPWSCGPHSRFHSISFSWQHTPVANRGVTNLLRATVTAVYPSTRVGTHRGFVDAGSLCSMYIGCIRRKANSFVMPSVSSCFGICTSAKLTVTSQSAITAHLYSIAGRGETDHKATRGGVELFSFPLRASKHRSMLVGLHTVRIHQASVSYAV